MKVYRIVMPYFDGSHEHGYYESPCFRKKEDAEAFKQALIAIDEKDINDKRTWRSDDGSWEGKGPKDACIREEEVIENWDGTIEPSEKYLHITWT